MVNRAALATLAVLGVACGPSVPPPSHKETMPRVEQPRDPCVRSEIAKCRGDPVRDHLKCPLKEAGQDGEAWKTQFFAFLQDAHARLRHARSCGETYLPCLDHCDGELVKIRDEVARLKLDAATPAREMDNYCYHVHRVLGGAGWCGEVASERACLTRTPAGE